MEKSSLENKAFTPDLDNKAEKFDTPKKKVKVMQNALQYAKEHNITTNQALKILNNE